MRTCRQQRRGSESSSSAPFNVSVVSESEISSFYVSSVAVQLNLVGNPEDRFSHDEARMAFLDDYTENKTAEQSDLFTEMNAALVLDNNYTTCSRTSLQAQPWWEVKFDHDYIIEGLVMTVPSDNLGW